MFRGLSYQTWQLVSGRHGSNKLLEKIERSHYLDRTAIAELQNAQLQSILTHCAQTVPYYTNLFREYSLNVNAADALAELAKLPVLRKPELRARFDALQSSAPGNRPYENSSGGSTGSPALLRQDRDYQLWSHANKQLFARWLNWKPGEPWVKIWGAPADIFADGATFKQKIRKWALREEILNCYETTEAHWHAYRERINSIKPAIIESYVTAIDEFADFLMRNDLPIHSPKGIITAVSALPESVEQKLKAVFKCEVINRYGSREVGDMACSCPEFGRFHISPLTHVVEILDDDETPTETEGNIVVSLLTNFTMPLLRYELGDRASVNNDQCTCGRNGPLLGKVIGRKNDYLLAGNRRIDGAALTTSLVEFSRVRQFQFHQSRDQSVELRLVLDREGRGDVDTIQAKLDKLFRGDVPFKVVEVNQINPTPTGKYLYVINELLTA